MVFLVNQVGAMFFPQKKKKEKKEKKKKKTGTYPFKGIPKRSCTIVRLCLALMSMGTGPNDPWTRLCLTLSSVERMCPIGIAQTSLTGL